MAENYENNEKGMYETEVKARILPSSPSNCTIGLVKEDEEEEDNSEIELTIQEDRNLGELDTWFVLRDDTKANVLFESRKSFPPVGHYALLFAQGVRAEFFVVHGQGDGDGVERYFGSQSNFSLPLTPAFNSCLAVHVAMDDYSHGRSSDECGALMVGSNDIIPACDIFVDKDTLETYVTVSKKIIHGVIS